MKSVAQPSPRRSSPVASPRCRRRGGPSLRNLGQGGFALLVTITLVAFLVLVLVALASLTRVETQVATNGQHQAAARQNALVALNVALGQVQQFTGPDRRVTARADLGNAADNAHAVAQPGARHWVGAWGDANSASADHGAPVFLNWLVSGNENTVVQADANGAITSSAATPGVRPDQTVSDLSSATAHSTDLRIASAHARVLVGPGTVGSSADGGLGPDGYVVAPLKDITIASDSVPGLTGSTPVTIGRYAWWVGDEGIKARANLTESEETVNSSDDTVRRLRYRLPARTGIELMEDAPEALSDLDLAASGAAAFRADLRKIVSSPQFSMTSGGVLPAHFIGRHFHDISAVGHGVLANTLAGGLRQDLTAAFAAGTNRNDAPTGPIWQTGTTDWNKGPDWQLLRSYYQIPYESGSSGSDTSLRIDPRPHVDGVTDANLPAQHGVAPIVAAWQWFIETRLVGSWPTYSLELRHYPAIVLWNPYNATLKDHAYRVSYKIAGGNVAFARVSAGAPLSSAPTVATQVPAAISAEAQLATPWVEAMNLTVRSGDMAPGEAYVYTLPADVPYTTDTYSPYTLTRGWHLAGTAAVVASGNSFTLTGASDAEYMVSFWIGTLGSTANTVPAWNVATAPVPAGSGSNTEPTLREDTLTLSTSSGDPLQVVAQNNNYENAFKIRFARSALLWQGLRANVGYIGHRWALKTTALGTLDDTSLSKNNPVRWLADYNPRAPYSTRSPFDSQGGSTGYGYFYTNPSYNFLTAAARYGSGAFDPINAIAAIDCDTDTGRAFVGMSQNTWDGAGESRVVLFDIPRSDHPVVSLGALQHAQLYRVNGTPFASNYSPAYALGNSLANPRTDIGATVKPWTDIAITGNSFITYKPNAKVFDHSYLLNRALWDGYYFSTVPSSTSGSSVAFPLANPRFVFNERSSAVLPADLRDRQKSAASLLVSGAFNINSTSTQAWRALLGGLNNVPVRSTRRTGESPYPRTGYPVEDTSILTHSATNAGMKSEAYEGYRFLSSDEINDLADEIVVQVRRRGPFLSIADFVNRALVAGALSSQDNRLMGAIAQAIADAGINDAFASGQQAVIPNKGSSSYTDMNTAAAAGPTATGVPGWLTQADVLQALGPSLSARSDTFTIRAYGETVNPLLSATDSGYIQGRAWCEAVVQRLPDYVSSSDDPWTAPADLTQTDNQTFGRRYKITSFRWLSSSDI